MVTILIGALLIGVTLGLLGSGGSTLTVPVLVYLVGHDAKISIAESMAIVGTISFVVSINYIRTKQVDWFSVACFGIPGMLGTFGGALLGGRSSDVLQLVVFGSVLLSAAAFMSIKAFRQQPNEVDKDMCNENSTRRSHSAIFKIVIQGFLIGVVTGFVGVGGGFLMVPALMIFGRLPMRVAVGTSLVIIVLQTVVGFAKYQDFLIANGLTVDWKTISIFGAVGIVGSMVGQMLNQKMNQRSLQQAFAIFLVLMGGFVVIRETVFNLN